MKEREEKIIDAAVTVFSRYGVKRSTMNDIAGEAGIARQTLYNAFSSKEKVLQATIRLFAERSNTQIEAGLKKTEKLGEQLDIVFQHITVEPYDLLRASPNAEDIVEGFNAASQRELEAAAEGNRLILARILEPYRQAIDASGLTVDQFADFVQRSATNAKYGATDRKHLMNLLAALKVAVLQVANAA